MLGDDYSNNPRIANDWLTLAIAIQQKEFNNMDQKKKNSIKAINQMTKFCGNNLTTKGKINETINRNERPK